MSKAHTICMLLTLVLLAAVRSGRADEPAKVEDRGVTPAVEAALLREDWREVAGQLKDVTAKTRSPVLRLLKGHACLALNRNNESVCLFLSVTDDGLHVWRDWTERLAGEQESRAAALYLRGDALARLGEWKAAEQSLGQAILLKPGVGLAHNARGVVYALLGELVKARVDFAEAVHCSQSSFADAYAGIGALRAHKKSGIEGAVKAFDKAIKLSPGFALALHGKACVRTANAGRLSEDDMASLVPPQGRYASERLSDLMRANAERIRAFWEGRESDYFLAMLDAGEDAGTTISGAVSRSDPFSSFKADVDNGGGPFEGARNQYNFNKGFKAWTDMSAGSQKSAIKDLNTWAAGNAVRQAMVQKCSSEVMTWNKHGGGADSFNRNLATTGKDLTVIGGATAKTGVGLGVAAAGLGAIDGASRLQSNRNKYYDGIKSFGSQLKGGCSPLGNTRISGGVDMNLADVHSGPGVWPFVGYFGLAYGVEGLDKPFALPSVPDGDTNTVTVETAGVEARESS